MGHHHKCISLDLVCIAGYVDQEHAIGISRLPAEQRAERIEQGVARARTFTWERCQQKTLLALRELR
jgi:hypothetical protein